MEKINIAELLKDCPKGMELDCTIYDNVQFDFVQDGNAFPIKTNTPEGIVSLSKYGCCSLNPHCKCVIFPKGKTTWKGFTPPCKFKNGDVVATSTGAWIGITTGGNSRDLIPTYCVIRGDGTFEAYLDVKKEWYFSRLATEEERQKLFKVIKDNGYKWNAETKVLERLIQPKFHKGDWIIFNGLVLYIKEVVNGFYRTISKGGIANSYNWDIDNVARLWTIQDARDGDVLFHSDSASSGIFIFKEILQRGTLQKVICYCDYDSEDGFCLGENHTCCWADDKILYPATKKRADLLFQKMAEAGYKWNPETKILEKLTKPRFKIGDRVRGKYTNNIYTIARVTPEGYELTNGQSFTFGAEDCHELVSGKFDISTPYSF